MLSLYRIEKELNKLDKVKRHPTFVTANISRQGVEDVTVSNRSYKKGKKDFEKWSDFISKRVNPIVENEQLQAGWKNIFCLYFAKPGTAKERLTLIVDDIPYENE